MDKAKWEENYNSVIAQYNQICGNGRGLVNVDNICDCEANIECDKQVNQLLYDFMGDLLHDFQTDKDFVKKIISEIYSKYWAHNDDAPNRTVLKDSKLREFYNR
jgi:hypothetical protein